MTPIPAGGDTNTGEDGITLVAKLATKSVQRNADKRNKRTRERGGTLKEITSSGGRGFTQHERGKRKQTKNDLETDS